jgi:hypothetical protein
VDALLILDYVDKNLGGVQAVKGLLVFGDVLVVT